MTIDHDEIRRWAEARGGKPACVRGTGGRGGRSDVGMIRLDFPTGPEPKLGHISWDEWFKAFEENHLALVYQDKTATGQPSRFNKLIGREALSGAKGGRHSRRTTEGRGRKAA